MFFPISGVHLQPIFLIALGLVVGVLGGFFGVGGSFLAGPALFAGGVPMHFVVGTDLAHIVGKSIAAAQKHRTLGNVDMKLGAIMTIGTISGVEAGAQLIQQLKKTPYLNLIVGISFAAILLGISAFMALESVRTLRMARGKGGSRSSRGKPGVRPDRSAFSAIAKAVHRLNLPPHVSLPISGVRQISLWVILAVAFVGGFFGGFLGGGAGYIRMPAMVYLLGIPTHVAVGTDLFEIIISAGYGTLSHALKGNVDILIALVMNIGSAIGARLGATCTQYFVGPRIRLAFIPLPLIGAAIMLHTLMTRAP
jgi:uncharacterized membrane protein YfcA